MAFKQNTIKEVKSKQEMCAYLSMSVKRMME